MQEIIRLHTGIHNRLREWNLDRLYTAEAGYSVPELLEDGRTGFLGDTVDELVEAVKRIDTIDRAECRRHVERRFSVARMVDDYETIYRRAVSARQAA